MHRLAAIDLNLLVALDALLGTCNVTRAGEQVGLSQPAMSHALSRLRDALQDPLLVRSGGAMKPTPFAERIAPEVRAALGTIERVLYDPPTFDPARDRRTFTIAASDYVGAVVLPAVVERLSREAPHVTLRVRAIPREVPEEPLGDGELDLVLGTFMRQPSGLMRRVLFDDGFVCVVRAGHPDVRRRLTLKRFVALRHLLVSSPAEGPGVVDMALEKHGLSREVACYVPHFLVAPAVVARSDFVLTLAARIADLTAPAHGLVRLKPPLELPRFDVVMLWHPRLNGDPAARWFRDLIADSAA